MRRLPPTGRREVFPPPALPGFRGITDLSASPGRPPVPRGHPVGHPCPRLGVSRVAYAFLVYMLSPLPRRSGWTYCFAHSPRPYQPSPKGLSGRPAHRPFRGLLGVHSCYGLHTRAVTVYRDTLTRGFSHFVTSMTAPVASGWSDCRVGLTPTGKRRLSTAHTQGGHCVPLVNDLDLNRNYLLHDAHNRGALHAARSKARQGRGQD